MKNRMSCYGCGNILRSDFEIIQSVAEIKHLVDIDEKSGGLILETWKYVHQSAYKMETKMF